MPRSPEPAETEETVSITVRFPRSVRDALRERAKLEERAFNTVVVRAARDYLNRDRAERKGGR